MNIFLILAFLFSVGSLLGWGLEVVYRRLTSKKWVNPGFLTGPYLPIYGFSLCVLYLMTYIEEYIPVENKIIQKIILFIIMAVVITCIEYIAGFIFIKKMNIKLWDYSDRPLNIQGIICPLFSFYWFLLSAVYYFIVHPHIIDMLRWLSNNLAFSFCVGLYFGIFTVDLVYSSQIIFRIKRFAEEKQIIIRLEELKSNIRENNNKIKNREKFQFLFSYRSSIPMREHLERYTDSLPLKKRIENIRAHIKKRNYNKK